MSRRRRVLDWIGHWLMGGTPHFHREPHERRYRLGNRLCYIATEVPSRLLG